MFPLIFQQKDKNRNSKTTKQLKTTMQLTINLINSAWIRLSENRKSEFWPISVSPRRQNHFPINHALLSMEKSSFGIERTSFQKQFWTQFRLRQQKQNKKKHFKIERTFFPKLDENRDLIEPCRSNLPDLQRD